MSAALTALVLGYCAGAGQLVLRRAAGGPKPLLVIKRSETEKTYLEHQLRALRKHHNGPLRAVVERKSSSGFYDLLQLRASSEQFARAYELLYPADQRCWSEQLAALAGDLALVNLWLDHGSWSSLSTALIKPPWSTSELISWIEVLNGRGIRCAPKISTRSGEVEGIGLGVSGTEALIQQIRPLVHRSMRERLWARKMLGSAHVRRH